MKKTRKEFTAKDHEEYNKSKIGDMEFDLEGSYDQQDSPELEIYKKMLQEQTEKVLKYEKFLQDRNMMEEADSSFMSNEEFICLNGIEFIRRLVASGTFTKDDINAFDVLYRNLCTIRGIKVDKNKKTTKINREEALRLLKK